MGSWDFLIETEKQRQHHKEYRQKNKERIAKYKQEYRNKNPEKHREEGKRWKAKNRKKVNAQKRATRVRGLLIKQECELCKTKDNLCLHHPDYDKPLYIKTLCRTCHNQLHNNPIALLNKLLCGEDNL